MNRMQEQFMFVLSLFNRKQQLPVWLHVSMVNSNNIWKMPAKEQWIFNYLSSKGFWTVTCKLIFGY